MRIVAYYSQLDANVIRRIVGPLSVLSQRGRQTYYSHVLLPQEIAASTADLVILPHWIWDGTLPRIRGEYCYDLTDAALLADERVINVLKQCMYAMVPTKTLATLVQPFCPQVLVQPSTVHADWFFGLGQKRPDFPVVACVGNYDWESILPALLDELKIHQQVSVVTTDPDLYQHLPPRRRLFASGNVEMYGRLMRTVYLALMPGERREVDPGPVYEFGLFGVPVIAGPAWAEEVKHGVTGFVVSSPQSFRKAFSGLTTQDAVRTRLGSAAQLAAREHTAVRRADQWLAAVEKFCPTAAVMHTL